MAASAGSSRLEPNKFRIRRSLAPQVMESWIMPRSISHHPAGQRAPSAELIRFPAERRTIQPEDEADLAPQIAAARPQLTVAEKTAVGMLRCGRSFAEAAESSGLSVTRVMTVWNEHKSPRPWGRGV
jgi:hypothetical protein